MNLLPNTSVNLSFGAIVSKDRQLKVPFSAMTSGKIASGNVIFEILEANSRQWAGESIILNGRVEVA